MRTRSFLGEGERKSPQNCHGAGPTAETIGGCQNPTFVFRPKKDPRDIRILDPACGSGHFLLYAFDLLVTHL